MIHGAYVLVSSILSAAIYTILITVFNDRVMEMIYVYMPVPVDSAYNVITNTTLITYALYAVPIIVMASGFLYFLMSGPRREADTQAAAYLGSGRRYG